MSGGTRSYEMARRLVAMGHEVHMVTSWREATGNTDWFETDEDGIKVHWLAVPYSNHMSYSERMRAFLRFAWKASRKAASIPADVVFATSTPLTIALPGAYASWRQDVPMVFEVRDLWPELPIAMGALNNPLLRFGARLLERFSYKRSSRIVALSPGMKEGIVRTGYPEGLVEVIPNSSDLDLFDPERSDSHCFRQAHPDLSDDPLVVYAGTMGRINGVAYLAKIAAEARRLGSNVQFVVVGRGYEEELVREMAEREGVLDQNFHMYAALPKRDVPDLLASADVALSLFIDLEPMWANSANKFFDALASGTPVAINYQGWQADLLNQSGAGVVLPAESETDAARQLINLVSDREALSAMGRRARQLAERQFGRDDLAVKLERVISSAVADQ